MDSTHKIDSPTKGPRTRVLDGIDRGHALVADRLHTLRNGLRDRIEHRIDRIEELTHSAITTVRAKLKLADAAAADGIIKAQGAVGRLLERARPAQAHLTS
ncbi:MAG: hypothetical protein AB7T06_07785 [Kofleriaceae bacterium]